MKLQVYLQLDSKFVSWCGVSSKNEILLNWTDSLPQHHAVAPSMPLPSQTHTYKIIHPQKSTNILATLLHPACLQWQGQGVRDDNMAALISCMRSLSPERHEAETVSQEEVTRVWRGALLSNQRTAEACQCYLLGPRCSFPLTDNRGGKEAWPGDSSSASERGGRVSDGETDTNRNKEVLNEKINLVYLRIYCHQKARWKGKEELYRKRNQSEPVSVCLRVVLFRPVVTGGMSLRTYRCHSLHSWSLSCPFT